LRTDTLLARALTEPRYLVKGDSRQPGRSEIESRVYALTAHTSQGSTFRNVFIDVPDIRKAEAFKPKEMQQLCYVALTRASRAAVLTGI
jgi:superfamily I DNA/RNA helicase